MKPARYADIAFFLGFAGIIYGIFYGTWNPERPEYIRTLAAMILGTILVIGSFIYLYKNKPRDDKPE